MVGRLLTTVATPMTSSPTLACSAARVVSPREGVSAATASSSATTRLSRASGPNLERTGPDSRVRITLNAKSAQGAMARNSTIKLAIRNSAESPPDDGQSPRR